MVRVNVILGGWLDEDSHQILHSTSFKPQTRKFCSSLQQPFISALNSIMNAYKLGHVLPRVLNGQLILVIKYALQFWFCS